jgi:hypothetical protein
MERRLSVTDELLEQGDSHPGPLKRAFRLLYNQLGIGAPHTYAYYRGATYLRAENDDWTCIRPATDLVAHDVDDPLWVISALAHAEEFRTKRQAHDSHWLVSCRIELTGTSAAAHARLRPSIDELPKHWCALSNVRCEVVLTNDGRCRRIDYEIPLQLGNGVNSGNSLVFAPASPLDRHRTAEYQNALELLS